MKLFEISNDHVSSPNDLVDYIKRNCSSFLSMDTKPLWRGMRCSPPQLIYQQIRNRRPVDTPIAVHNALNDYFMLKFNKPYRNGVFVTSNEFEATSYGDSNGKSTAIVFPINGFSFCWSPKVTDLYRYYGKVGGVNNTVEVNAVPHDITNTLDSLEYQNTDLRGATNSGHEIMIDCPNGYIAIDDIYLRKIGINNSWDLWSMVTDQ